jgi:hypothetical protein
MLDQPTNEKLDALGAKVDDLHARMERGFAHIDERFERVDERFERVYRLLIQFCGGTIVGLIGLIATQV